jgi:lia operon protein LiaI
MMIKLGLLLAGGIAALVLLSTIGPLIGLMIKLVLLYILFKQFLKTKKTAAKIGLGIVGLIILMSIFHHMNAIIGIAAAVMLYLVCKKWNEKKHVVVKEKSDPFVNFEKQWNELNK